MVIHKFSRNPDNTLESQYPCIHVLDVRSDSKLLSDFTQKVMNYYYTGIILTHQNIYAGDDKN
jgi:hypothetical protein